MEALLSQEVPMSQVLEAFNIEPSEESFQIFLIVPDDIGDEQQERLLGLLPSSMCWGECVERFYLKTVPKELYKMVTVMTPNDAEWHERDHCFYYTLTDPYTTANLKSFTHEFSSDDYFDEWAADCIEWGVPFYSSTCRGQMPALLEMRAKHYSHYICPFIMYNF